MNTKTEYALVEDCWLPCMKTQRILPAGVYRMHYVQGGLAYKPHELNTDDLKIFPGTLGERIIREIDKFWTLSSKYKQHGLIHKRGVILHGVPGTGKTAILCEVARKTVASGGIVLMRVSNELEALIEGIQKAREATPVRPILVLLEDIDDVVESNEEEEFLSFLDGESQVNHIMNIATTNNLKALPDRIKNRPSRFDLVLEVPLPSQRERFAYLMSRMPKEDVLAKKWSKHTKGLSLAHLRELVVGVKCLGLPYTDALHRLRDMEQVAKEHKEKPPKRRKRRRPSGRIERPVLD